MLAFLRDEGCNPCLAVVPNDSLTPLLGQAVLLVIKHWEKLDGDSVNEAVSGKVDV